MKPTARRTPAARISRSVSAQEWVPVAHADEHRQRVPRGGESRRETVGLRARQLGDRRDAAEQLVVMRDFFDALRRHASSAQDVGQERTDVVEPLGAAEGDDEDGVEHSTDEAYWEGVCQ